MKFALIFLFPLFFNALAFCHEPLRPENFSEIQVLSPKSELKETRVILGFISNVRDQSKIDSPLGIAALNGHLREAFGDEYGQSLKVSLTHNLVEGAVSEFTNRIMKEKPNLLGLSLGFGSLPDFVEIMKFIRELPKENRPLVAVGNVVATYNVEYLLSAFPELIVISGLGEDSLTGLIRYQKNEIPLSEIPNIAYTDKQGNILRTRTQSTQAIGRHLLPHEITQAVIDSGGIFYMETSRGCPFHCTICDRRAFQSGGWRGPTLDDVVQDMIDISALGVRQINFVDEDFFAGGVERVEEFAEKILQAKKDGRLPKELIFNTSASVRHIWSDRQDYVGNDESLKHAYAPNEPKIAAFKKMYRAGLRVLFVGIESGSPTQIKRYGKAATIEENKKAIKILSDLGIMVIPGFIMLDPLVTPEEVRENIQFLRDTKMGTRVTYPLKEYLPMKGSPLTQLFLRESLVNESSYKPDVLAYTEFYFRDPVVAKALASIKEWEDSQAMFFWELKIIFRSAAFGNVVFDEQVLIREMTDEQTLILLDYLDAMINLTPEALDLEVQNKVISRKFSNRLMKDFLQALKAKRSGAMTLGGDEFDRVVYRGMVREVIRLHFAKETFSPENILDSLKDLDPDFPFDSKQIQAIFELYVKENRISGNGDETFSLGPRFWDLRDIPWSDLPRKSLQEAKPNYKIRPRSLSVLSGPASSTAPSA